MAAAAAALTRLATGLVSLRARGWHPSSTVLLRFRCTSAAAESVAAAAATPPGADADDRTIHHLARSILAGDRMSLARAITLCESSRPEHSRQAGALLRTLIAARSGGGGQGHDASSSADAPTAPTTPTPTTPLPLRIAFSGPPGAGKSTLIEALGCALADAADAGARVAVLAVDPTSPVSGGAVLGDRTRMPRLSAHPNAFVRASPARGALGGVARATADACTLCEAAGYGTVLLETVGVGQSEVDAADVADAVVLVLPPGGAGDELQAMKRGLMEVVDVVAVNKADGDGEALARRTAAELRASLAAAPPGAWGLARWQGWRPRVLTVSARTGKGVGELVEVLREFAGAVGGGGTGAAAESSELAGRRARGRERLAWSALEEACLDALRSDQGVAMAMRARLRDVRSGMLPARAAADEVVAQWLRRSGGGEGGGGA
jgi:LAO/AO transport system kinase